MQISNPVFDTAQVPDNDFIVNNSLPKPELRPGIYFLIKDGEIVYVGQSVDCEARVKKHIQEGEKGFTSYHVFPCHTDHLNLYEAFCLWKFQPKYNHHLPIQPFITVFGAYVKANNISLATKKNRQISEYCKTRRYWSISELNNFFNRKTAKSHVKY